MDPAARDAWTRNRPGQGHPADFACPAPWVSLEFDPSGWVLACCASQMYPLGRIGDQRLPELWGGPRAQVMREALQRWDLTVACVSCRWHLEHGRYDADIAVYDRYPVSSLDPASPYMMQFALSNRCNLGCVMCNAELSSVLRSKAGLAPLPKRYGDQFFDDLEPMVGGLGLVKFAGGEPFLVPEHRRVWALLDRLETPPHMLVTTNGTIWTETVEWVLDRFSVDITVSVDAATPETYAGIRRGGDFATVMSNVERFHRRCVAKGTTLTLGFCLMNRNWFELGSFLLRAERFESLVAVNVVSDDGLALHDLPSDELRAVAEAWAEQDGQLAPKLALNAEVWATQRRQLDTVLAERSARATAASRQPKPVPGQLFSARPSASEARTARPMSRITVGRTRKRREAQTSPDAGIAVQRDRLMRWSGGGPVAEIVFDADGFVRHVPSALARLGIDERLVGTSIDELTNAMASVDGRPAWVLDMADLGDHVVRTIGLSSTASRGTPGSIVRIIDPRTGGDRVRLLAEDRIYESPEGVPRLTVRG